MLGLLRTFKSQTEDNIPYMLFSKQQVTRKIIEVKVLVAQSCLDSLQAHGLQPARLPCPWLIHAFELLHFRRLLRAPRAARRSNQSILKEINSEYLLEGLMLKL